MVALGTICILRNRIAASCAVTIIIVLAVSLRQDVRAQNTEYERFVHTYVNPGAGENFTYLEKPVFPVLLNDSQIAIGENWSLVVPLVANHSYHVYCYGKWVDNGSTPKTDYDIYVYDSLGELEGCHTEAAGLPEHLGNTVDEAFFVPKLTGNYTFVIVNDPRESKGAQEATFMIIEHVDCDVWLEHYVEGKDEADLPVLNTSWAYEFVTESKHVEVYVRVPDSLDLYETRLYLMCDPKGWNMSVLNDVPLAWEPGLFGNRTNSSNLIGGYNLESKEYRGAAYSSCEFYGQDMFLNFTSPFSGKSLYHLVLIGEVGGGTIEFLVKTEFNNTSLRALTLPRRVYPNEEVSIEYTSVMTDLENATLDYSVDSWENMSVMKMEIFNKTCKAVIPGQVAGIFVSYRVNACDVLENTLTANGSFWVKDDSLLNFSRLPARATLGENVTIAGAFEPRVEGVPVTVYLSSRNESVEILCYTRMDGTFITSFKPEILGTWDIYARFNGTTAIYECESPMFTVQVEEPLLAKYSYYVFGVLGTIIAVGIILYVRKSKA